MHANRAPSKSLHNDAVSKVLSELDAILADESTDFRPSLHAYARTRLLIEEVGREIGTDFPYGYVYGDGDGGIRIDWENADRQVRLQVSAKPEYAEYIYHQQGKIYNIEESVSSKSLARWLRWLNG